VNIGTQLLNSFLSRLDWAHRIGSEDERLPSSESLQEPSVNPPDSHKGYSRGDKSTWPDFQLQRGC